MKKSLVIVLLALITKGCAKNYENNNDVNTVTPSAPLQSHDSEKIDTIETPEATYIPFVAINYYEDTDNGSTISLINETQFETNLNVCSGFVSLKGDYTIIDNVLTLNFLEATGFDFIDENQPFTFEIKNDKLTILDEKMYSCAMVDTYYSK